MNVRNLSSTALLGAVFLAGCATDNTPLPILEGTRPVVSLDVAPSKGDSTGYLVHFEWSGTDADG